MIYRIDINPEIIDDILLGKIQEEEVDPYLYKKIHENANMTSDQIKKIFSEIIKDTKKLKKDEMEKKYDDFNINYKKIYEMAIESVIKCKVQETINMLNFMLNQRDRMKNGYISQFNAGLVVGNKLGHEYVYPKTKVPTTDEYKKAIDEIKNKIKD